MKINNVPNGENHIGRRRTTIIEEEEQDPYSAFFANGACKI